MAAAEARTAWQRTVNRYFVQEDAKRAPKFACCPPSTLSTRHHQPVGFVTSRRTSSYCNLRPDTKWWEQMESNYGLHRALNFEEFKSTTVTKTSTSVTTSTDSSIREIAAVSEESIHSLDYKDMESFYDVKNYRESKLEELGVAHGKIDQDFLDVKNMTDYYKSLEMEMEMVGGSVSERTSDFCSNADSWFGGEKVPWWRVADGEELASFVAQKSLHHVENCDLPPPQKIHVRKESYKQVSSVDDNEFLQSAIDWEAQSDAISSPSISGSMRKHWYSFKEGPSNDEDPAADPWRTSSKNTAEKGGPPETDPSKVKLLEALCHSQTRAREAEKAAKQAHSEKEDLLKLFFRQASQLFAYKQWFKLLQLEALLLQTTEATDPSPSPPHPLKSLPWMPQAPGNRRRKCQKSAKAKGQKASPEENDIGKCCVAFALGFTLVGAGFILGWTVGWLLPAF